MLLHTAQGRACASMPMCALRNGRGDRRRGANLSVYCTRSHACCMCTGCSLSRAFQRHGIFASQRVFAHLEGVGPARVRAASRSASSAVKYLCACAHAHRSVRARTSVGARTQPRTQYEVYSLVTKHNLSEAAVDDLLEMLSYIF